MSIQYCVAATLARGVIAESNYRVLDDPEITRLASITRVETDAPFTEAYPRAQGSEVVLTLRDGRIVRRRLDDVVPATPHQIRARFRTAAGANSQGLEETIDKLEQQEDVGASGGLAA
jgi:2-methylcitrate dehydratase PrpD